MNDIEVRFPGLLDAELNESERLCPLAASLTLNLYGSSEATITLPEDAPYIRIHDWVSLYTQDGFAGIFRVTNISRNFKRNLEITLLHGIDILSDSVWAEQDKFTGTMEEFLTKALNFQTHLINGVKPWVLGMCEDNSTTFTDKEMNYDRLSTLLEGLIEEGGDYYYEYNMTSFPWTLNVRRKSSVVWSEFRLSRNVTTANVTYNDADLCTRLIVSVNNKTTEERGDYTVPSETVYPDQSAHGLIPDSSKVPGSTAEVTSNETTIKTYDSESGQRNWGIVVKTADIDLAEIRQTWPSVDAWAANFMGLRSQPSVQIQIDGEELAQLSGDNWDELALGRNCRVCLPTYSPGYFDERVVSVTYPDLFSRPSHVTVSLANALPKFSESITRIADKADSAASSARSAGRYAASAEELTKWSQIVEYYGEALDGTGVMTLYRSGIEMDAAGGVKIYSLTQGAQSLYAGIQVTSSEIASEIRRAQEAESSIRQTADSIATRVSTAEGKVSTLEQTASSLTTRIGTAEGNISTLQQTADSLTSRIETAEGKYSLIEQTATKVGMVVVTQTAQDGTTSNKINVSGIVTAINNDNTTETVIQANKIVLNSNQTQISISDIFSASSTVKAPAVHTAALYADSITTAAYGSGTSPDTEGSTVTMGTHLLSMSKGTGQSAVNVQFLGDGDANLNHSHVLTISEITTGSDAGKIQVTLGNPTVVASESTGNFKIADTQAYRDGVSAARNSVEVGIITWTGPTASDNQSEAHGKRYSLSAMIPLVYQTGVDGQGEPVYTTIRTYGPISQNVTGVYDAGWDNGSDSVTLDDPGWSPTNQRTISTVGRHTEQQSVTVSVSGVWDTQESSGTDAEKATAVYRILGAPAGTTPTDGNTLFTTSPVMSFQTYDSANHILTAQLKAGNKLLASAKASIIPGTATPGTPQYTSDGVYTLSAAGTVTIDGTVYNLTAGTDTFTATEAINYGRTLVSLNAPTVNQITGQLTASRSFTVAMSGSGTSPEPSKTVYTKLELSGSKVQLKWNSDGGTSYPNTAAEYDISSLVTARMATNAGTVTLTASDINASDADGNATGTRRSTAANIDKTTTVTYDDTQTTSNVPVTINAQAIYDQGCYDGWDKARLKNRITTAQASSLSTITNHFQIRVPSSQYNQSVYYNYAIDTGTEGTNGTYYAYLRYSDADGSPKPIVARCNIHSVYTAGVSYGDTIGYDRGVRAVSPTNAVLSNTTRDSSTGGVTASLTVSYTGNKTKTFNNVNVKSIYDAGFASGTETNSYPATFDITMSDGDDFSRVVQLSVDCSDAYNAGAQAATPTDYGYRYTNSNNLRIRSGPGTNYSIVASVKSGAYLHLLEDWDNTAYSGWILIEYSYGGKYATGYVSKSYLTTSNPGGSGGWVKEPDSGSSSGDPDYPYNGTVYANEDDGYYAIIYASESVNSTIVTSVHTGEGILCKDVPSGYSGDWMHVKYNDSEGYIRAKFVVGTDAYKDYAAGSGEVVISTVTIDGVAHQAQYFNGRFPITIQPKYPNSNGQYRTSVNSFVPTSGYSNYGSNADGTGTMSDYFEKVYSNWYATNNTQSQMGGTDEECAHRMVVTVVMSDGSSYSRLLTFNSKYR